MTAARNVLIFHAGALGDVVLSLPVGLAAARIFPQSRVMYVAAGQKGRLAAELLGVEHLDIESGWGALHGEAELPESVARCLAKTHTVISFLGAGDGWRKRVTVAGAEGLRLIELSTRPTADWQLPLADFWQAALKAVGQAALAGGLAQIVQLIQSRGLKLPASNATGTRQVMIHPGSGGVGKCWPSESFIELAKLILRGGSKVEFVIGEAERDRWSAGQIKEFAVAGPVRQPATVLELAALLSSSGAYVGNDSGPSHLAGMLGVPSVVLFGPTDPAVWRPMGPRVTTLRGEPMGNLGPALVYEKCRVVF